MKKRIIAAILVAAMTLPLLTACHDSSENKATVDVEKTDYDPKEAVKDFEFGELTEEDKNYVIEMGYFNCDHMCCSIIGEKAGIYDALGLNVNLTKSPETVKALVSGAMDAGYIFFSKTLMADDSPVFQAAANHLGGSRYLVVSNDIDKNDPSQLLGKTIACVQEPEIDAEWRKWAEEYNISYQSSDYNLVAMGQKDAMFALKAGQIDAFACCDPYASQAEFEGFGQIMFISWGANLEEGELLQDDNAGTCCSYAMSVEFREKHPELARRLIYAHMLAVEYLYSHPYNAAMMFADGFEVDPYVGLRTVYMKTVAEGRTITWQWSEQVMKNNEEFLTQWTNPSVPEEDIIFVEDSKKSLELSNTLFEDAGVGDFNEFISSEIDDVFPLGMTFEDWYNTAKKIDGISDEDAIDISDTATPYLNENLEEKK